MSMEKLPSGSYRVTVIRDKKKYRVTFDHRPTKREAEEALQKKMLSAGKMTNGSLTIEQATEAFIEMKKNVLSPNTIREYSRMPSRCSKWFASMPIDRIDQIAINRQVNEWSEGRSAKTVSNYHGFISTILATFRPDMKIYTTLPQKRKIEPYTPSDEDVRRILSELKGTEYYVGTFLASMGMRRGEILALLPSDVEGNVVHITKAMAIDVQNNRVIKQTKTTESERDIIIPWEIADLIREQGFVYRRKIGGINEKLTEVQKKLGIPHFSMHKLRHYFASKMVPVAGMQTVMDLCGWKTDYTPRRIYIHAMAEEKEKAKKIALAEMERIIKE